MELDWYQKMTLEVAAHANKTMNSIPTKCLCPGCMHEPINSHSQQAHVLSLIAQNGKVITPSRNMFRLVQKGVEHGKLKGRFQEQNIKQASTFRGFCQRHDTELFFEIEQRDLSVGNVKQALAFHRRAMSFELKNKFDMIAFLLTHYRVMLALGGMPPEAMDEFTMHKLLLRGDFNFIWAPLWTNQALSNFDYAWRTIPHRLGVSMTSCLPALNEKLLFTYSNRYVDLRRNTIDRPRPSFTLTIVPQPCETHVIMAWNRCVEPFIEPFRSRMLSKNDSVFSKFLNECVFCMSEDYCLSPNLWASLCPETKAALEEDLLTEDIRSQVIVPDIIKV